MPKSGGKQKGAGRGAKTPEVIRSTPWNDLNNKQQAFLLSYVTDWNAPRAAREAGYASPTASHNLLANKKVKRWLGHFKHKMANQGNVDVQALIEQINFGVKRTIKDFITEDGLLPETLDGLSDAAASQIDGIEQEVTEIMNTDGEVTGRRVKTKFKLVPKAQMLRLAVDVTGLSEKNEATGEKTINWDDMAGKEEDDFDEIEDRIGEVKRIGNSPPA